MVVKIIWSTDKGSNFAYHRLILLKRRILSSSSSVIQFLLSHDLMSRSDITPCIKMDKHSLTVLNDQSCIRLSTLFMSMSAN